jgi:gliding motility-associated-like protein
MTYLYRIIFVLFLVISVHQSNAKNRHYRLNTKTGNFDSVVNVLGLPTATLTVDAPSVCINGTKPVITFKGAGGTAPYTFNYTLNGVVQTAIVSSGAGDTATINVPTGTAGSFVYALVSVTDSSGTQPETDSITIVVNALPIIDFTYSDNQCVTEFNSSVVQSGTYSYNWDFGDGTTSTSQNPSHSYIINSGNGTFTYNVKLTISNTVTNCVSVITKPVLVKQKADASLNSSGDSDVFNGIPVFKTCSSSVTAFTFYNASSTSATNVGYTINWGDGSPDFVSNGWTSTTHTYQIGFWNMTYTIVGANGCSITKKYIAFVGTNPAVSLGNPGNTDICSSSSLTFPISGTENNPPGTTYIVTFADGSAPQVFSHPPPVSITHTFLKSSCGVTSSSFQNSFSANIVASNPCGVSSVGVVPIYVSTPPVSNFSMPLSKLCIGVQTCFTNTSTGSNQISSSGSLCNSTPKTVWVITPSVGVTLVSGSYGNDFGSTSAAAWTSGSDIICPKFSVPGVYTITMKAGNRCGSSQVVKTICIEPQLVPQFTLNQVSGCTPSTVSTTNTTDITNSCITPTYLWSVAYSATNCGNAPAVWSYTGGTTAVSASPSFNFVTAGTYSIALTTTNSCGSVVSPPQTVVVKKPPAVVINSITTICQTLPTTSINPTATITNCGSQALTYAWSFPNGTPATSTAAIPGAISYSTSGTYTVSLTVTNECGSTIAVDKIFTINPVPALSNTPLTQTICSGLPTTLVNLTSSSIGATFMWTATATPGISGFLSSGTSTIPVQTLVTSGTSVGTVTYAVTPKSGTCTGATTNYVISIIPAPQITAHPVSSAVCQNGIVAPLTFTLSGVTGTPTYQWYSNNLPSNTGGTSIPNETNVAFSPSSSVTGTFYYYCIISLPSGGCSGLKTNVATIVVAPLVAITAQPTSTQNLCVGSTIAAPLAVSYSGGTGPVTYQWYSNVVNSSSTGTLIVGETSSTFSPSVFSVPGTTYYYVSVTGSGTGCGTVISNVAEVIVSADPTLSLQPIITQTLCQGAAPQNLQVTATGGIGTYTYQWYSNTSNSNSGGSPIVNATNSTYAPITSLVGTTYYYCMVIQSGVGCGVTSATAEVKVIVAPTIINQPMSSTVCQNGTPTTLAVTLSNATGIPTYQWYSNSINNTTLGTLVPQAVNPIYLPSTSTLGTLYYYCVITLPSGGCSSITSNTATITVNAGAVVTTQPTSNQSLCVGGTIATPLSISYSGGSGTASYQWFSNVVNSNVGGTSILGATNANYTPLVFNSTGTFYYYCEVALSGNGCGSILSDVSKVIVVSDPTVSAQPLVSQVLCQNVVPVNLTVSAVGGLGTYSYQWYLNANNSNVGGILIANATNASYTPPTVTIGTVYYYCEISQSTLGCGVTSAVASVIVNAAPTFTKQPISSLICLGDLPNLLEVGFINGAGTPSYQWYSNGVNSIIGSQIVFGETNPIYRPPVTAVGTLYYYCVITLPSGGCSSITSSIAEVRVKQNPVVSSKNTVICSGTSFTVKPDNSGGDIVPSETTYIWANPIVSPSNAVSGAQAQIIPKNNISQALTNSTSSSATVTYTVTPSSGVCKGNDFTVVVTVNPSISSNVTIANSSCFLADNGSVQTNIAGGIPFNTGSPYVISWTGPNGFLSDATSISSLLPGIYSLSILDQGGCPFSKDYEITQPDDILIATDLEKNISCFGDANGKIAVTVSGGTLPYKYDWTKNGVPFATTDDISNLGPGVYVLTVLDDKGCGPKTKIFRIIEPPVLDLKLVSKTNVLCNGYSTGAIIVKAEGGTPTEITPGVYDYNYAWTGANGFTSTTKDLSNVLAGTYNLTVTDNSGCFKKLTVIITQPTGISITPTTTPIVCYGGNNASIRIAISGGITPYEIVWSNLGSGLFQDNLSAGDYLITVTDGNNCVKTLNVNIPEPPIFTIKPVIKNVSCFGAHDASINLNIVGGIAPVKLVWDDSAVAGNVRNNLGPGNYTVTITDGKPCAIKKTFVIIEPQPLVLAVNKTDALDCDDPNSGAIDLLVSGGTPPFTYTWSNGAVTEDLSSLPAGNYLVSVTDSKGCNKLGQCSINRQPPLVVGVETKNDFDCETKYVRQTFVANVSGGVPPYKLAWSSGTVGGANNEIMNSNQKGAVVLAVIDDLGCNAKYSFNINVPVLGNPSFTSSSYAFSTYGTYSIVDPIQFTTTATGDYVKVVWNFGDGSISDEVNPIHIFTKEGSYVVVQTVTYPLGCIYTYTLTLKVDKGYQLMMPNAFTPNGDGINETFKPTFIGLQSLQFDVYDTWGELLYSEKGDTVRGWDGKIKGESSENGNYFYKVMGKTFYGSIINEKGPFVLIK